MPAGNGEASPSTFSSVGSPASRVCSTSFSTCSRLGCGSQSRCVLGASQDADEPAHLRERGASGLLDRDQRLALALLVLAEQAAHGGGLDGHHAHRVTDDVVQLARDARALLRDGRARLGLALALEPLCALDRAGRRLELAADREAREPREGERERDPGDFAEALPRIVVDDE